MKRRITSKKLPKIEARDLQFRQKFDHKQECRQLADPSTRHYAAAQGKHLEQHRVQSDMKEIV
jgi:hypothetical protein